MNSPRTRQEAEQYHYGSRIGFPNGVPWDETQCAATVPDGGRSVRFHQCNRKPGHGPEGLYCRQHAKILFGDDDEQQ